jgi:hypothetical protein
LNVISWILQLVVAVVLGQTLFFKLTGAEETKALFEVVGGEPALRYLTAIAELAAVVLLLVPRTAALGALLSLGVILPAIGLHLTVLGVSIDPVALEHPALEPLAGPSLFLLAVVVLAGSIGVLAIRRREIPIVGAKLG